AGRAREGIRRIGREIAFGIASLPLLVLMLAIVGAHGPGLRAVTWLVAGWAFFVGVACTASPGSRVASATRLAPQVIPPPARVAVAAVFAIAVVDSLGVGTVPFGASCGSDVSRAWRGETG